MCTLGCLAAVGMVAHWLVRSLMSGGSQVLVPLQLPRRDLDQVLCTQLLCNTTVSAPLRRASALLNFLCSAFIWELLVRHASTSIGQLHAFSVEGPSVRNGLPLEIMSVTKG